MCSKKFRKFHKKTSVLDSLFNKVVLLNFIKKRLQHRCFLVKLAKFVRTSFFAEPLHCFWGVQATSLKFTAKHLQWTPISVFKDFIVEYIKTIPSWVLSDKFGENLQNILFFTKTVNNLQINGLFSIRSEHCLLMGS